MTRLLGRSLDITNFPPKTHFLANPHLPFPVADPENRTLFHPPPPPVAGGQGGGVVRVHGPAGVREAAGRDGRGGGGGGGEVGDVDGLEVGQGEEVEDEAGQQLAVAQVLGTDRQTDWLTNRSGNGLPSQKKKD